MSVLEPLPPKMSMSSRVVITATTGLFAGFVAYFLRLDLASQVILSVFIAGVTFVVTYLIEVDHTLQSVEVSQRRHAEATERQLTQGLQATRDEVREGFQLFSKATEVFLTRLAAAKIKTDIVARLLDNMARLDPNRKLEFAFAERGLDRLATLMHDLAFGNESVYDGEDRDWMLDLTRSAEDSIQAISLTTVDLGVDGGLWMTDLGQRYLRCQEQAIARGVKVKRVFIAESRDRLRAKEFLNICEMHHKLKVEVRTLDVNSAPGTLGPTIFDFIIFDEALSYESVPASQQTANHNPIIILTTRLVREKAKVEDRIDRFKQLWAAATPYLGLEPPTRELPPTAQQSESEDVADAVEQPVG